MLDNHPIFAKTNWARDHAIAVMMDGTNTQRIVRFVFGTIRYFVVEGAKFFRTIANGLFRLILYRKSKNFC